VKPELGFSAEWPAPANIRTLITTRSGGVSAGEFTSLNLGLRVGDEHSAVQRNRVLLSQAAGHPLHWLNMVHGAAVKKLPTDSTDAADAAWTDESGVVCLVTVADCLPVLLARRDGTAVGVAHAGWRGLASGVIETTANAMAGDGGELMAWLGPAIGPDAFEVGPEVIHAFTAADPGAGLAFRERGSGKWLCDLFALARRRLHRAGITAVYGGGLCTYSEPSRFFSHRRATHEGSRTGRMAALIWLE
jgi:YfiH family protein